MPLHQYRCPSGHIIEKFFRSFSAADGVDTVPCNKCVLDAERIISVPLPAMFFGNPDGYHSPSPLKRYNTKVVSQKSGNDHAAGFIELELLAVLFGIFCLLAALALGAAWLFTIFHFMHKFW